MELDSCIKGRRSVRSYTNEPVSKEQIEAVLEAGTCPVCRPVRSHQSAVSTLRFGYSNGAGHPAIAHGCHGSCHSFSRLSLSIPIGRDHVVAFYLGRFSDASLGGSSDTAKGICGHRGGGAQLHSWRPQAARRNALK